MSNLYYDIIEKIFIYSYKCILLQKVPSYNKNNIINVHIFRRIYIQKVLDTALFLLSQFYLLYILSAVFVNQHMQNGIAINLAALARSRIMLHLNFSPARSVPVGDTAFYQIHIKLEINLNEKISVPCMSVSDK